MSLASTQSPLSHGYVGVMNKETHSSLFQPYSASQEGNRWFNIFSVFLFSINPGACRNVNLPEPQGVTFCHAQIKSSHPIFSTILMLFASISPPLERPVLGLRRSISPRYHCCVCSLMKQSARTPAISALAQLPPRLIITRNEQTLIVTCSNSSRATWPNTTQPVTANGTCVDTGLPSQIHKATVTTKLQNSLVTKLRGSYETSLLNCHVVISLIQSVRASGRTGCFMAKHAIKPCD